MFYYGSANSDLASSQNLEFLRPLMDPLMDVSPGEGLSTEESTSDDLSVSSPMEISSAGSSSSSSSSLSTGPSLSHSNYSSTSASSSSSSSASSNQFSNSTASQEDDAAPPLRQSNRVNIGKPPAHHSEFVAFSTPSIVVPATYKQAKGHAEWDHAMQVESDALDAAHTWDLVPRRPEYAVVGSKWVYNIKMHPDGTIERHKARVVAQGFRQAYGIDYAETFAPVAKMQTVRSLLAVAAMKGWPLIQLDVKNAFLHGDLKEVIYMERPPGYTKGDSSMVCRLRRSLYGLKQAPRAWFEKFQDTILRAGFVQSDSDPSLFLRTTGQCLTVLLIYVDDMVISGDDEEGIREVTDVLRSTFNLKELGNLAYFLGLEVHRSSLGIHIGQRKYVMDLLEEAQMDTCTPCATLMEQNLKLRQTEGEALSDGSLYRSIVGSLIYLTHTRPDISYVVQVVSQYMSAPRTTHWSAVQRILRYLEGTTNVGLLFPAGGEPIVEAYADTDYAGCWDTRRSTSGWCVKVGNSFISWRCKKQDRVSKSSTEAEYRSMSEVASEITWLCRLLSELGVVVRVPVRLHVDNTSAIRIATNPVLLDRTKHIEVHVHYIRQLVTEGVVELAYITSEDQTADLLTKAVSSSRHWFLAHKLMLRKHHQFEGGVRS
ncbi:unnamed protein product [Linum trigynum]|uniref:Reverse transcriptase Ty1/copia-type domain-containing protein n=1 Tax=Linum trigynum TaxID=586398 RepID=A0AAV2EMT5_9ROSI